MNYPYLITGRSAMVRIGQRLYQVDVNHPRWDAIGVLLRSPEHNVQALRRNMDPSLTVTKAGGGAITLDRGQVRFKGKRVPDVLSAKLTAVLDDHGDLLPWVAKLGLVKNPRGAA